MADVTFKPIESMDEDTKYAVAILLYGETLVDEDFNPSGIVEGYWQDGEGWIGAVWCGCHDVWEARVIEPTHYALKPTVEFEGA